MNHFLLIPLRWTASVSNALDSFRVVSTILITRNAYNLIGLLSLIDRLLQLHQLPLLLADKGHPLIDLPLQLRHARIDITQVVAVDE